MTTLLTWPEGSIGIPNPEDIDVRPRTWDEVKPFDTAFRPAKVLRVVDADTYELEVSLGFFVTMKIDVRLIGWKCGIENSKLGVNSFETSLRGDTTPEMKARGLQGKSFCQDYLAGAANFSAEEGVLLRTRKGGVQEGLNRWLGLVLVPNRDGAGWVSIGDLLLQKKLATVWWAGWNSGSSRP